MNMMSGGCEVDVGGGGGGGRYSNMNALSLKVALSRQTLALQD